MTQTLTGPAAVAPGRGARRDAEERRISEIRAEDPWTPRAMPPVPSLTHEQSLAVAFRHLAALEFSEDIGGHITWVDRDDDTMLINPWGLWWEEVTASDIVRVDADGNVVEGRWDVTPAYHIHTELHRRREDARVVVHNHPYHVTVLAALGVLPRVLHQTTALYAGDLGYVYEYDGEVNAPVLGAELADRIGDHSVVVLGNHGLLVTGRTLPEAVYRAAKFDRQCRLMIDVLKLDREATEVAEAVRSPMRSVLLNRAAYVYWAGAVRQQVARTPEVLR